MKSGISKGGMRMIIFLTGATGYAGSAILNRLVRNGHQVYCLVRPDSLSKLHAAVDLAYADLVHEVAGDVLNPDSYEEALRHCSAIIHLVGIIRERPHQGVTFERIHIEATRELVKRAQKASIRKFIHMSALGARENAVSGYHRSKYEAEQSVKDSGIPYCIFRPSVIFGPRDEFVNMLAGLIKLPLTPVIGNGRYRLQPVSIQTVSEVFVKALEDKPTNQAFELGGPEQISYNDMIREIALAMNKKVVLFHQPLWLMKPVIRLMERFSFFPITNNQLTMLLEENICRDGNRFVEHFQVIELPFAIGIREYIH